MLYARSADTDQEGRAGSEPEAASAEQSVAAAASPRAAGAYGPGAATVTNMLPGPAQDPMGRQAPVRGPFHRGEAELSRAGAQQRRAVNP